MKKTHYKQWTKQDEYRLAEHNAALYEKSVPAKKLRESHKEDRVYHAGYRMESGTRMGYSDRYKGVQVVSRSYFIAGMTDELRQRYGLA